MKIVYNFSLDDIKEMTGKDFEVEYDKNLGDVLVFSAIKEDVSISYTQSLKEKLAPGYVTVSRRFQNLTSDKYKRISNYEAKYERFNMLVRPEGDLDSINLVNDPKHYHLSNRDEAITLLNQVGKQVDVSLVARFDNKHNRLEEVKSALQELVSLNSELS